MRKSRNLFEKSDVSYWGDDNLEGKWQSCGWTIEADSFLEAAKIVETDKTFRIHSLSDSVVY